MKVKIFETCGQFFVYDEDDVLIGHTRYIYILWLSIIINDWQVEKPHTNDKV